MKKNLLTFALSAMLASAPLAAVPAFASNEARAAERILMELPVSSGPSAWDRLQRTAYLKGQFSKLYPVKITYDDSNFSQREKDMLKYLLEAADSMDRLFRLQAYDKNQMIIEELEKSKDPLDQLTLKYLLFNACPFDRINNMYNFFSHEPRPEGAAFYPDDMTKQEFEQWIKDNPQDKKSFTSEFTMIKRGSKGKLASVPYGEYFKEELARAIGALKKAADLCDNKTLKKYILSRAEALKTDDYYISDVDWMSIEDSNIELIIGPYEVYEDKLMNYKAAYECFIYQNIPEEAAKFSQYVKYLPEFEKNLPIPDKDKVLDRDFTSPIRIVNLIYSAGDAKAGIHTSAFALPNDERVRKEKGCKKVMMKNVMSAKFDASTLPIGVKIVDPSLTSLISFDAYFRAVVFHELAHGLGPGQVKTESGDLKDVRLCLGDIYSSIEECKADTLAMYNEFYLMDKGIIPESEFKEMCVTYLTGLFRSVRFGTEEAHGQGALIQLNWMMDHGAFSYDYKNKVYSVNFDKFREANAGLTKALLDIQRTGSYTDGIAFLEKYAKVPDHLTISLEKLYEIPIDILPEFMR